MTADASRFCEAIAYDIINLNCTVSDRKFFVSLSAATTGSRLKTARSPLILLLLLTPIVAILQVNSNSILASSPQAQTIVSQNQFPSMTTSTTTLPTLTTTTTTTTSQTSTTSTNATLPRVTPIAPPNGTVPTTTTAYASLGNRWWIIDYWSHLQGSFSGYSATFTAVPNTIGNWASGEFIMVLPINIAYGPDSNNCVWFQFDIQFNSPPLVPVEWNIQNNNCPASSPSDFQMTNIPISYVVGHSYIASMSPSSISPPQVTFSITDTTTGASWAMTYSVPSTSVVYNSITFSPASAVEGTAFS